MKNIITKEMVVSFKEYMENPAMGYSIPAHHWFFENLTCYEGTAAFEDMNTEKWAMFGITLEDITQWVIDGIQGTCTGSIDGGFESFGVGDDEITGAMYDEIDNNTFNCPSCGWWSYTGAACDNGCIYVKEEEDWFESVDDIPEEYLNEDGEYGE